MWTRFDKVEENSDVISYKKVGAKLKVTIYTLMYGLIQHQIKSVFFFNILLVIEFGQFLWYAVHPQFPFLADDTIASYVRAIRFFQVDSSLRDRNQSVFFVFFYFVMITQGLMIIGLVFIIISIGKIKKKTSSLSNQIFKFMSFYCLLMKTIAPLPFFHTLASAIICMEEDPILRSAKCYQGLHIIVVAFAIPGIISLILFSFMTHLLFIDLNPTSQNPLAAPRTHLDFVKLILKFLLPIYVIVDFKFQNTQNFIIFYSLFWLVLLILRYNSGAYYNGIVSIVAISTESLVFWGALVSAVQAFIHITGKAETGFFYFIIVAPFAMYTYYQLFIRRIKKIKKKDFRSLYKIMDIEIYLYTLSHLFENRENPSERIELEGLLRYHMETCSKTEDDCPCHKMILHFCIRKYTFESKLLLAGEEILEINELWLRFIKSLINESLNAYPRSLKLHLLSAYFYHSKLNNKYKALYELMIIEERYPSLQEGFAIYNLRKMIEKEMIDAEIRDSPTKNLDINQVVEFQEKLNLLEEQTKKATMIQINFWEELGSPFSKPQNLLSLAAEITKQTAYIKASYASLCQINPGHIRMLEIYGHFIKNILNDSVEGQKMLDKAEYAKNSLTLTQNFTGIEVNGYQGHNDTCIITCSANLNSLGIILSVSNEMETILQYLSTELVGGNISQIMPAVISQLHDRFMRSFFDASRIDLRKERLVFPVNKAGYIVPCKMVVKTLPNLSEGLKMVCFLKKVDVNQKSLKLGEVGDNSNRQIYFILFGGEHNIIQGVSKNCNAGFGISSRMTIEKNVNVSDEFTIEKIFPDILNQDMEEMKTLGKELRIDTTSLPNKFLLNQDDSNHAYEGEDLLNRERFRVAKVQVALIEDTVYMGNIGVKVIKFVEIGDNLFKVTSESGLVEDELNQIEEEGMFSGTQTEMSSMSNMQVTGMNEEGRMVKDLKSQISETSVPSVITTLKRVPIAFVIMLIIVICIKTIRKKEIDDELVYGLSVSNDCFERHNLIAEINIQIAMLDLLSRSMLVCDTPLNVCEANIRTKMNDLVQILNDVQFSIIQGRVAMNKTEGNLVIGDYEFQSLLQDGNISKKTGSYNKSMWRYIGVVQRLVNSSLASMQAPLGNNSTKDLLFYAQTNGLGMLRQGSENIGTSFITFYSSRADVYQRFFIITTTIAIALVVILQAFILVKIMTVRKTNAKALTLFAFIPPSDIRELINGCQDYLDQYYNHTSSKLEIYHTGDHPGQTSPETQTPFSDTQKEIKHFNSPPGSPIPLNRSTQGTQRLLPNLFSSRSVKSAMSESHRSSQGYLRSKKSIFRVDKQVVIAEEETEQMKSSGLGIRPSFRNSKRLKEIQQLYDDEKEEREAVEFLEHFDTKSTQLKRNPQSKRAFIVEILSLTSVLILYFGMKFAFEMVYITAFQNSLDFLQVISKTSPYVRYANLFGLKELMVNNLTTAYPDGQNMRTYYSKKLYENQLLMKMQWEDTLPSQFSDYFKKLNAYHNENTCGLLYESNATKQEECQKIGNVEYNANLIQREIKVVESTEKVMVNFYAKTNRTVATQKQFINSEDFKSTMLVLDTISPAISQLKKDFVSTFISYVNSIQSTETITLEIFLGLLLPITLFIWVPFIKKLKSEILRTKGLLNLIPVETMKKSVDLREAFVNDGILNVIR